MQKDIIIVGAGIVGLSLARELNRRHPNLSIMLLEKEPDLGKHASGRNSGVLHAGIYYPPGTLKARLCVAGARQLVAYCEEENLPFHRTGKIIVPVSPTDNPQLDLLAERATGNGVTVEWLDADSLKTLEPEAYTITGKALYSPMTGTFDPLSILTRISEHLTRRGVEICFNKKVDACFPEARRLVAGGESVEYGHLFNTAGLYADVIARAFQVGTIYRMMPFKGLYFQLSKQTDIRLKHHLYPVPDLTIPFLGVHFTNSVKGQVYCGPTAIPALGRENYHGLEGLDLRETPQFAWHLARLYLKNTQGFRMFAHQEGSRFLKRNFVQAAQALVPRIRSQDLQPSQKVGIRAQLYNSRTRQLEMDFVVEPGLASTHILNAVSPAFSSAFAFASHVLDEYFETQSFEKTSR